MKRFDARLRQQRREDEKPTPVWIQFDHTRMTPAQAIAAAIRSGKVPANATFVIFPQPIPDRETWSKQCRQEQQARERSQRQHAGTEPAGSTTTH